MTQPETNLSPPGEPPPRDPVIRAEPTGLAAVQQASATASRITNDGTETRVGVNTNGPAFGPVSIGFGALLLALAGAVLGYFAHRNGQDLTEVNQTVIFFVTSVIMLIPFGVGTGLLIYWINKSHNRQ